MPFFSFEFLDHSKPIVIFGRDGQVGKALQFCFKDLRLPVVFLGRSDCDLSNESSIREVLDRFQPQVIINAAAYTDVDQAEVERELAFVINARAPQMMAQYIANIAHGVLIHYSTDYVFADTKKMAYSETDTAGPMSELSIYGQSKLAGENAIQEAFEATQDSKYFIMRTSWVYGEGENFIHTILRLAGERDQLKVVADQVGVPTSAQWLAEITLQMAGSELESGIYHVVPDGETSWHSLAVFAIQGAAAAESVIQVKSENILPVSAANYPSPVKRPSNSRLSNTKLKKALSGMSFISEYPDWHEQVEMYVRDLVRSSLGS
jgi:dTDP-4-dehydrorhamnose reductase